MDHPNGPRSLTELFATSVFQVPAYQRAYAWDIKPHLTDFLGDLKSHPANEGKRYFFGTVLLTDARAAASGDRFHPYAVVDGQQRLTTACIFIAAAIRRLSGSTGDGELVSNCKDLFIAAAVGNKRKFLTIEEDQGFFERFIIGDEAPVDSDIATPSQRRLWLAKCFFQDELSGTRLEPLQDLLRTLLDCHILVYAVTTNAEATQIFELQNDRGKRLTDLEALKSYLMHGLYIHAGENTESDLAVLQNNFANIYRSAEQIESYPEAPNEDSVLAFHCIAFERWLSLDDKTNGWTRPKLLVKKILSIEENSHISPAEWIKAFSNRLQDSFCAVRSILEARDKIGALGDLTALGRAAPFWPLLMKCWRFDNGDSFSRATRSVERFAFRSAIAGKRSVTGESRIYSLARDFAGDFDSLVRTLEEMRSGWNIPELFEFGLRSENFYSYGRLATYLLWRYENYLRGLPGRGCSALSWRTMISPANAAVRFAKDHIEPKDENNPALAQEVRWRPDDPAEKPRPFRDVFLNRLGNLVLDTISTGAAKGNSRFDAHRIEHYRKSDLLSQHELVSEFASAPTEVEGAWGWDLRSIRSRQESLVKFALETW